MKKTLKTSLHFFSLFALVTLVSFGGFFAKLSNTETAASKDKDKDSDGNKFYSVFPAQTAFADAPPSDGGGASDGSFGNDSPTYGDCSGGNGGSAGC